MSLKLMYITNNPTIASLAEAAGVDRLFVDMEYIGKDERQGGMDTVQSHHTVEDVECIRSVLKKAELLVRCNPIHGGTAKYSSSREEIDAIINSGAEIIMLPYFKTADEVRSFVEFVGGRAKTVPLIETPEAVNVIDEILAVDGLDEIYVGLNDLSIGYGKKFMFELLADGTVERLCSKFKEKGIAFGFGGVASLGMGLLPAEKVIAEHYRLGSSSVILSRSFCDVNRITDLNEIHLIFRDGIQKIRDYEAFCERQSPCFFAKNAEDIHDIISQM